MLNGKIYNSPVHLDKIWAEITKGKKISWNFSGRIGGKAYDASYIRRDD